MTERGAIDLDAALAAGEDMTEEGAAKLGRTMPLLTQLMEQSHRDTTYVTNALLDGYKADAGRLRAELAAVRTAVTGLLNLPYAPAGWAIKAALWPSDTTIAAFERKTGEL